MYIFIIPKQKGMRKTIVLFFLFLFSKSFAKENSAFIGLKINNGKTTFKYSYDVAGIIFTNLVDKQYHIGAFLNAGGTIKNISIYSGIGYNLYQYRFLYLAIISQPNGQQTIGVVAPNLKLSVINIPVNIDYNINVYKQKLFVIIGIGTELCYTFKKKVNTINQYGSLGIDNRKPVSFAITARTGLLYNINKRLDCFASFDFSHHVTSYLEPKEDPLPGASRPKLYPYNLLGSIGLNIKFYKNTKEKNTTKE